MNYIVLITEILLTFFLIFLAYKMGKKDGLYLGIGLFSSILCVMLFKMINMFDFDVNMGIPFIVGILLLNNIIIHIEISFITIKISIYLFCSNNSKRPCLNKIITVK